MDSSTCGRVIFEAHFQSPCLHSYGANSALLHCLVGYPQGHNTHEEIQRIVNIRMMKSQVGRNETYLSQQPQPLRTREQSPNMTVVFNANGPGRVAQQKREVHQIGVIGRIRVPTPF